jgi:aryl-alcohol dehydrogenase-like predicted oxidoreductase
MNYRTYGNRDLEVSEICFGPMRFSAKEPGADEKSKEGKRALLHALDRGVNFIHSSYEYGTRWAVGQALREYPKREELHHIIKVPVPDFDDGGRFDADKFRLRVEEALRDLHAERIDILQHLQRAKPNEDGRRIPDIPSVHEPMMEIFGKLEEEGKVGYLATFPYSPGFAEKALATGDFSGMVAYYNPIEVEMVRFFEQLRESGKGFICIRPFMAGLLTDKRIERESLPEGDRMREERWNAAYERLHLIKDRLGRYVEGSWTEFAVKFALADPVVTSLIVGLNSPEQVDGVLDAADGRYPDASVVQEAWNIYQEHGPAAT